MAKAALGDKQICPTCGAKFYDLGKRPAICPKCAAAFDPADETVRLKRTRGRVANYDAATDEDEDEEAVAARPKGDDADEEEEIEEAPELDVEVAAEPVVLVDEDDDEAPPAEPEIPAGFSEDDGDIETVADDEDDGVPLLEDEEEFPEDELGELPAEEGEDR